MRAMAHVNLAEIEAGKMAQSKSKNQQILRYSQQMIDDHTKAQGELQSLADAKGMNLPSAPDKKRQDMLKKLGALSGAAFDSAYMAQGGVNSHKESHEMLQAAQTRATDPELKALAGKALPTVDQHLKMAQDVKSGKGGGATVSGASGSSGVQ
ncbi:DUF4142 domain-containing protein [Noviherbaspirillum cavernae]|uniref:DUF4142 domain-containing protein n=2 Tax=Noviherbaspirillum cavernae TaxID=2320862 RepID=A0A418X5N3_9BURK|nr:DUF4142 domain-containing protein [Noviherbaspirillum cavernae]